MFGYFTTLSMKGLKANRKLSTLTRLTRFHVLEKRGHLFKLFDNLSFVEGKQTIKLTGFMNILLE